MRRYFLLALTLAFSHTAVAWGPSETFSRRVHDADSTQDKVMLSLLQANESALESAKFNQVNGPALVEINNLNGPGIPGDRWRAFKMITEYANNEGKTITIVVIGDDMYESVESPGSVGVSIRSVKAAAGSSEVSAVVNMVVTGKFVEIRKSTGGATTKGLETDAGTIVELDLETFHLDDKFIPGKKVFITGWEQVFEVGNSSKVTRLVVRTIKSVE